MKSSVQKKNLKGEKGVYIKKIEKNKKSEKTKINVRRD
tara:strand:- start:589 stop:702 length:114 start_codon:yes stop_codon:yes gene_type:complete